MATALTMNQEYLKGLTQYQLKQFYLKGQDTLIYPNAAHAQLLESAGRQQREVDVSE